MFKGGFKKGEEPKSSPLIVFAKNPAFTKRGVYIKAPAPARRIPRGTSAKKLSQNPVQHTGTGLFLQIPRGAALLPRVLFSLNPIFKGIKRPYCFIHLKQNKGHHIYAARYKHNYWEADKDYII